MSGQDPLGLPEYKDQLAPVPCQVNPPVRQTRVGLSPGPQDGTVQTALVIGHPPTLVELIVTLTDELLWSYAQSLDLIDHHLATSAMTEGQAAVERLQLDAEMHELFRPSWQKTLIVLFWICFAVGLVTLAVRLFILVTLLAPGWLPQ